MGALTLFLGCLFGLVFGSFVNVVVSRSPRAWGFVEDEGLPRGLAFPPSQCDVCERRLSPLELIPVVSFIALGGRCRSCGAPIGWRHPLVELLGGLIGIAVLWRYGVTLEALAIAVFLFTGLTASAIDAETGYLPDTLTLPLIPLGIAASLILPQGIISALIGVLIAGGGSWLVAVGYQKLRGIEGLGGGDVKFLAAIGAWTGATAVPFVLLIASLSGIVAALALMIAQRSSEGLKMEIRFGPFLAGAAALVLLFAPSWVFA